jgi:hypothetical protein
LPSSFAAKDVSAPIIGASYGAVDKVWRVRRARSSIFGKNPYVKTWFEPAEAGFWGLKGFPSGGDVPLGTGLLFSFAAHGIDFVSGYQDGTGEIRPRD